jgi:putative ABC transport system ATP-binding protein
VPIAFQIGVIEQLAFPDQTFDVVLSTLMMHHLPASLKAQGLAEIARVLKPGGRLVIADFTRKQERAGLAARFHAGGSGLHELAALVADAGFSQVEIEELRPARFSAFPGAGFVRASKSADAQMMIRKTMNVSHSTHKETKSQHSETIIDLHQVTKTYEGPAGAFTALKGIDLQVRPGEFIAVVGRSGSGKTTLLNLLAGIDRLTSGEITIAGMRMNSLSESRLAEWRGRNVGLVFQFFQLLPTLTVAENVQLPMDFAKNIPTAKRRSRSLELLDRVGIQDQADKLPAMLSGGQQQRAAIARALANDPPILLADEPTGNLDSMTGTSVLKLFAELNADGRTIIMVTHERDAQSFTARQVTLVDGLVASGTQRS